MTTKNSGDRNLRSLLGPIVYCTLISNIITIVCSLIVDFGAHFLADLTVVFLLITWIIDLVCIFLNFINLDRETETGRKLRRICYLYLLIFFIAFILMMARLIIFSPLTGVLNLISYYSILGFGLLLSITDLKLLKDSEPWIG